MDERGDHTETEIDAMTEEEDENHHQFVNNWNLRTHIHSELVEHATEHTAGKTEGEESDVGQEVAKQSS